MLTEEKITSPLVEQFGSRSMHGREQLVSLFYYMGMLTFGPPAPGRAAPELVIPNRVMRELQWEFLALSVKDTERVWMDTLDAPGHGPQRSASPGRRRPAERRSGGRAMSER